MSRVIYGASRTMARFGALVLVAIAVMSVLSIIGRAASSLGWGPGPIPGDFELVEAGTALAVFCFLPWCHLNRGHAVVDLFWRAFPAPMKRVIEIATDLLMLVVWVLLVWRMGVGMLDYREYGDTTFILRMPIWWGYAAAMVPGIIGCLAYAWRLGETLGLATPPVGVMRTVEVH